MFSSVFKHVTFYLQKTCIGELFSLTKSLLKTSTYAAYNYPYFKPESSKTKIDKTIPTSRGRKYSNGRTRISPFYTSDNGKNRTLGLRTKGGV